MRVVRLLLVLLLALACAACGDLQLRPKTSHLEAARQAAEGSTDAERVGTWLFAELVAPGGDLKRAASARKRLTELGQGGVMANLARAVDHDLHGRFPSAASAYLRGLKKLQAGNRADGAIVGWFVANRLRALNAAVPSLWKQAAPLVERVMAAPGPIGWRARGELVDWWSVEAFQDPHGPQGAELLDTIAQKHGCLDSALIAGPFGSGALRSHRVHFEAERPAPWPARFAPDLRTGRRARTSEAEHHACVLSPKDPGAAGVYYVQSFIELPAARDVIVAVQGAYALFVDDEEVLTRDRADWGVWPRFGVRLRLAAGRHRILARLISRDTSIRVLGPTGTPLGLRGSADEAPAYTLSRPRRLADPNALEPFLRAAGVASQRGTPAPQQQVDTDDPIGRYIASYLAHLEKQDDVASVLMEPLVTNVDRATPIALAHQAVFIDGDPIFAQGVARDLARGLRQQAADRDPNLWGPQLWLVLEKAGKSDAAERVSEMEALAKRFPEVPSVIKRLANMYAQLGWPVEHQRTLESAAKHFPKDIDVLKALLELHVQYGKLADADALEKRIQLLDPTEEVALSRALLRRDYQAAIAALERIGKLRRDRRDIAIRIADLLTRAGKGSDTLAKLELALDGDPTDAAARLEIADARFATGHEDALTDALVEAIQTGSSDGELRTAIELVEGATDFEPYRKDATAFIKSFEASGVELPGTAVRVLDYGAIWVSADGNARMLEHELIRVQSREGIARHVEQQIPRGLVLRMRTIKSDGRVFEPELVAGKPTVTMPHLEVGDYIETESIWMLRGAADGGRRFRAPRWFFREENTSYHHSEFVLVSPRGRDVVVETTGSVPKPNVEPGPGLSVRRWTVTGSIALPEEPLSAPVREFLPSVRVGWGVDLDSQLRRFMDIQARDTPRDPRMVRIARTIVAGKLVDDDDDSDTSDTAEAPSGAAKSANEKARRIYRWVLDTIQPGKERDPTHIITGKSGDRTSAFLFLCRLVGVDARLGVVRDRLSPPSRGPFSEAETFNVPAVRIKTKEGSRWLVVADRFAPYGFLPSSLRGQPAVLLETVTPVRTIKPPPLEYEKTTSEGSESAVIHSARVALRADGSADMLLEQVYRGRYAVQLRGAFNKLPESRRKDEVEAKLLGMSLPGGRVKELDLVNLDQLDAPVKLTMQVEVPTFARSAAGELVLEVPFLGSLAPLVRLPERVTPLYISPRVAVRTRVSFAITLPKGARVITPLEKVVVDDPLVHIEVADHVKGRVLHVERVLYLPPGRVQPADYKAFKAKVLEGSEALAQTIRIKL
jgi:tetratricopeptide (TPR) repeat protein